MGQPAFFEFDTDGDSAWIRVDTTTIEKVRFQESLGIDLVGTPTTICMTPRGIANPACSSTPGTVDVAFQRSGRIARARILAYGQFVLNDSTVTNP